jgi:methanogenic corrinoid protein MtbC1
MQPPLPPSTVSLLFHSRGVELHDHGMRMLDTMANTMAREEALLTVMHTQMDDSVAACEKVLARLQEEKEVARQAVVALLGKLPAGWQ